MSRTESSRNDPDAWAEFARSHAVGDVIDGTVTSIVSFGAFVRVADGIEGLLHESEMERTVPIGQTVRVEIGATDDESRRISLVLPR